MPLRAGTGHSHGNHGRHGPRRARWRAGEGPAEAPEKLEEGFDTLVVDKTGTLTEGRPRVASVIAAPSGGDEAAILRVGRRARTRQRASL